MKFIQTILRGVGQVMLQNSPYSGVFFLAGLFYADLLTGFAAIAGTVVSTATALSLSYPKEDIESGIYGFNGTLVGIALFFFFGPSIASVSALVAGAALSTPLNFYLKKVIPPFTASFVSVTWLAIYLLVCAFHFDIPASVPTAHSIDLFSGSAKGFGQVMFQENSVTGILFLLGLLVSSRIASAYAIYAALVGLFFGVLLSVPNSLINAGLMGYNGILCAVALADNRRSTFFWITLAAFLSVVVTLVFSRVGVIALTAPFLLSTWAILALRSALNPSADQPV